jgi:hypothetical protein
MKLYSFLLFAVLLHSCADTARKKIETQAPVENWQVENQTMMNHTYNNYGLLDTTYETQKLYADGQIGMTLNHIITRSYDSRKNLIAEKTFHVLNKNKLSEVKRFDYDKNNNVVEETKLDDGVTSIIKRIYNNLNQEIKEVQIAQAIDFDSSGNKKVQSRYDTSVINTFYDKPGNVIKKLYSGSNEKLVVETISTQYLGGRKVLSYSINKKGDTTSVTKFEQIDSELKSIREDKIHPFITDTSWYKGKNLIKYVMIDNKMNFKRMETYKYDEQGNVIENTFYR